MSSHFCCHGSKTWLQLLLSIKLLVPACCSSVCSAGASCLLCRGVFGNAQNALRARSVQRVQLWKGLHPSALSEAVSHFTKVPLCRYGNTASCCCLYAFSSATHVNSSHSLSQSDKLLLHNTQSFRHVALNATVPGTGGDMSVQLAANGMFVQCIQTCWITLHIWSRDMSTQC